MMNIVAIRKAAEAICQERLPRGFGPLPYQYDLDMNDDRSLERGYAVTVGQGNQVFIVDNKVNIEQDINIKLTKKTASAEDDGPTKDCVDDLLNAAEAIIVKFCMQKLGRMDIIQKVTLERFEKPDKIDSTRGTVLLEMTFRVRYLLANF